MINTIASSLTSIIHPRFYETERGFQGAFLASLERTIPNVGLPHGAIVEQEYQKRFHEHGLKVRPDIIIHVPTPIGSNRRHGNFAVFELKLAARDEDAQKDFASLDSVLAVLDYPLAFFVNIAAEVTHANQYKGPFPDRIHWFATRLVNRQVKVRHAYFNGANLVEEEWEAPHQRDGSIISRTRGDRADGDVPGFPYT